LIRIPHYTPGREKSIRAELRFPDPSANPYLALTVMLASALDGIDNQLSCPEPLNNLNVYRLTREERLSMGIDELPGSLAESLRELEGDAELREALGLMIFETFVRAKWAEVDEYRMRVTDWEVERYLETA
jgi:glutamine synthetase